MQNRFFKDETRFLRTLSSSFFFTINYFAPSQTFYFPFSITCLFFLLALMFPKLVYEIAPQKRKKPDPSILDAIYYRQDLEIHYSIKGYFLLSDILTDRHSVGRS